MTKKGNDTGLAMGKTASVVPFALFVASAIGLSFVGTIDINLLVGIGVAAIMIGALLTRDGDAYWSTIFEFFGSRTAMTATLLWLVVGVYGNILKEGHIVDGLVWAAAEMHIGSTAFTLVVFLFSGLFAISTGSGFGTISAMSLTLFPAGVAIGASSALLGGAILSGAALGDSIAPVSDTAVIAATTQEYGDARGVADIGGTIRQRVRYVALATIIATVGFLVAGFFLANGEPIAADRLAEANPLGLTLLIPTLVVIALALRRVNIFISLFSGIALAIIIGLTLNLFTADALVRIDDGRVSGAVADGVDGMANVCLLLMVVVSLSGLIIRSGCMESLIGRLNARVISTQKSAELTIFALVALAGILIAAVNTIANICIAPFVNSIGRQHGLHPYRRATILATVICTFPFVLPYGGCVLLLLRGTEASANATTPLLATDVFFTALYPWALLVTMLVSCAIGQHHTKKH